jgi:outer membrane protein
VQIKLLAAAGGFALAAAAVSAHAEAPTFFGYNLSASIRAEVAPTYEGGKNYSVFPGGSLAVSKPWQFDDFWAPDDAASLAIVNTRRFSFGAAGSIRENRGNGDELQGMRNIGWSLLGGGFMNVWPTSWMRVHVEALKGLTAQSGLLVNSGIDLVAHPRGWNLSAGPRYSWADDRFNNTYFGVTPAEALASPLIANPYTARAGPHFAGAAASAEYKLKPNWRLTFDASYHHMLGDDEHSPLVRQLGKADQIQGAVGLRFVLG